MDNGGGFQFGRGCSGLAIAAWVLVVVVGIALVWFGFLRPSDDEQSLEAQASATAMVALVQTLTYPTATGLPAGATVPPAAFTATPLPTDVPEMPTATVAEPATATAPPATAAATTAPEPAATPSITAGGQGANVRAGPGTNYRILGSLDPGDLAAVTGRYGSWWQILYNDASGWVYGEIVTAEDTDGVPEVQPPPAPTSPPATATSVAPPPPPPTNTPPPAADTRGLVVDAYQVEGAPGPYSVGQDIWFNMWITNKSGSTVEYAALGTWIQENNQYQKSYTYSSIQSGQQFSHRDHIYANQITAPGTYHLYLRICFHDGVCNNLAGPVQVVVQ